MVINEKENKQIHQFQVEYMPNPGLNINKAFREQVESNMALELDLKTVLSYQKFLRKENTHVISIMMFYETRKKTNLKVLNPVVYCIMENDVCDAYLFLQQAKLYCANKRFENTTFNKFSGITIPELLMNIISCHGFVNDKN